MRPKGLLAGSIIPLFFAASISAQEIKPSLEEAYRSWNNGFSSETKDQRLKTLAKMLPTKSDIEHLFPKHADKAWPKFDEQNKFLAQNIDDLAKDFVGGGEIKKIKSIDVRADTERASGSYKQLLTMIPKDVAVYEIIVERTSRSSGGGTYLHFKGRWFWIRDLDRVPKLLEKL